jgi:cyclophilin family peptidyl-prolyl cis-trans isomerase
MKSLTIAVILLAAPFAGAAQDDLGLEVSNEPRVQIETSVGDFVVELDRLRAPLTVENFLHYVNEGHYEGTIFHRVLAGFIAQGGGYTVDMKLKPTDETVYNESGNGLSNLRGTIAMARASEPHSATSQFYINLADNLDLNPRPTRWGYAVFGKVVEGMDVADRIGHTATGAGGEFDRNVPVEPIIIERMVILTP